MVQILRSRVSSVGFGLWVRGYCCYCKLMIIIANRGLEFKVQGVLVAAIGRDVHDHDHY